MTASCKPGNSEELSAAAVLLMILVVSDDAVKLVEAEEKGLVLPGGGGSKGLVNLGKSVEGNRAGESWPPLPGNWKGEATAAGGRLSGDGVGKHGTGTPAVWDKYVTNFRSSSMALVCISM